MAQKKFDNFFVRVAAYRREHPRATQQQAIDRVKKERPKKVNGPKPKPRTRPRAITPVKAPHKRTVVKTVRVTSIGSKAGAYERGKAILKTIDSLERERKRVKGREAKNFIQRMINAEHDKLDTIAKSRHKSA